MTTADLSFKCCSLQEDEEIARLTASLAERISKFLQRRGLGPDSDPEEADPLRRDQPWLAGLYAAAVSGKTAYGPNAGRRVTRIGDQIDPESMDVTVSPRCANVAGFSLHANVRFMPKIVRDWNVWLVIVLGRRSPWNDSNRSQTDNV